MAFAVDSSNHCHACRASSMCQLADLSVVAHTSKLRLERCATRSVKTSPFCDPARLPSKGSFLRPTSCDACRAPPGVDLVSRACAAYVGFAANVPSSTSLHRDDPALLSQTRWSRLGPRSHPLIGLMRMLLWARRSLSTSATSFQSTTHEHESPRALSSPAAGVGPTVVATHDALLTLLVSSSLDAKKIRARCAAASYA